MPLDVETPDPPSLHGPQPQGEYEAIDMADREVEDDYRREELRNFLAEGAWHDAFEEWAAHTELPAADFERVLERGLFDRFDFYWDPTTDDVGYRAPTIPDGADDYEDGADGVEAELDDLGRVVSERLENDYLLRDEDEFGFFADEAEFDEG